MAVLLITGIANDDNPLAIIYVPLTLMWGVYKLCEFLFAGGKLQLISYFCMMLSELAIVGVFANMRKLWNEKCYFYNCAAYD